VVFLKRSIVLLPSFSNISVIEGIREKYDPLAKCVPPHITLVFPFESDLTEEALKAHLADALKGVQKFPVLLRGITGDFRDGYLFLNVKRGNDQIIELHDRLYAGVLEPFLVRKATYCPHLTVGRLLDPLAFDRAAGALGCYDDSFETVIDKVYVETIAGDGVARVEFEYGLE
jgi:2'-5' RNA ligase